MKEAVYLSFEGVRRKKTAKKGKWQEVSVKIPMSDIINVVKVDNSDTCECPDCEEFYGGQCRYRDGKYYQEGCPCVGDWYNDVEGDGDGEKDSYIEIETEGYAYRLCQGTIFHDYIQSLLLDKVFEAIKKADFNVSVRNVKKDIEEERQKEKEQEHRRSEKARFMGRMGQKKTCNKCKAYKNMVCLMGYGQIDGIPQEPCVKPERVCDIEYFKLARQWIREDEAVKKPVNELKFFRIKSEEILADDLDSALSSVEKAIEQLYIDDFNHIFEKGDITLGEFLERRKFYSAREICNAIASVESLLPEDVDKIMAKLENTSVVHKKSIARLLPLSIKMAPDGKPKAWGLDGVPYRIRCESV
jgi:hypothetical protein